jgi:hypothetical protein
MTCAKNKLFAFWNSLLWGLASIWSTYVDGTLNWAKQTLKKTLKTALNQFDWIPFLCFISLTQPGFSSVCSFKSRHSKKDSRLFFP